MQQKTTKTIHALLVDDETEFTSTLSKRLNRLGMVTKTAADGSEGFGILETTRFDVVVLDINMPGVNGLQTLKAIKQCFHEVEVIILTGHGGIPEAHEAIRVGAFDFLFKPTRFEKLAAQITKAANKSGNHRPTRAVA